MNQKAKEITATYQNTYKGDSCSKCGKSLRVFFNKNSESIYEPCKDCFPEEWERLRKEVTAQVKQNKVRDLMEGCMLSPRFKLKTFDNYTVDLPAQKKVLEVSKCFAENFPKCQEKGTWIAFLGKCGTGKGHLAASIVQYVIEHHGVSALYIKLIDIVSRIKSDWNKEEAVIKKLREVDLLVIDEIGVQFNTEAERLILYRILDHRYEYLKPTIITSNHNLTELEKIIGQRIISRLYDRESENAIYKFVWDDYRQK